jgi:hypothetical protein
MNRLQDRIQNNMSTKTKFTAFHNEYEKATMRSNAPESEFETFGQALFEIVVLITTVIAAGLVVLVCGGFLWALNIIFYG